VRSRIESIRRKDRETRKASDQKVSRDLAESISAIAQIPTGINLASRPRNLDQPVHEGGWVIGAQLGRVHLFARRRRRGDPLARQDQPIRVSAFPYCPSRVSVGDERRAAVSPRIEARPTHLGLHREIIPTCQRARGGNAAGRWM